MKRQLWLAGLLAFGLAIALMVHFPFVANAQVSPLSTVSTAELRGVWLTNIDSNVLFSRRNLNQGIRRLAQLNFNTIYPTVWNWGYTLYPSSIAAQVTGHRLDPQPGLQGRDMLAEAINQGHRRGLAVIPWFEFGLMAPADSDLARLHPDWITSRRDGSQVVMEGQDPRVWLNPAHPEVQRFIVDLVTEVVANYDVDGIQFDDHFGLPFELGYDPYTVQLYQQEHQGKRPPADPHDPEWMRWRATKITQLMSQLFYAVKALKPNCLVSLSPNPREFAYDMYLQDWWTWERRGYVEELIVQLYRPNLINFLVELQRPEIQMARTHIPVGIGILAGLKNRPVDITLIQDQVRTVRDRQLAGVSFFFYESLGDRDTDFLALFPTPAQRPRV
nr:glycoside hydrolase family 10 protein [Oculatella sp. LEGE 06141]